MSLHHKPKGIPLFSNPWGRFILQLWWDGLSLHAVCAWMMPMMRAQAVAVSNNYDVSAVAKALYLEDVSAASLGSVLQKNRHAVEHYAQAEAAWRVALFEGKGDGNHADLTEVREQAARASLSAAGRFFLWRNRIARLAWSEPSRDQLQADHGARLADPSGAFAPPKDTAFTQSAWIDSWYGRESWLRFTPGSNLVEQEAWARMIAPPQENPPTLIVLHGVGVEPEFMGRLYDPFDALARSGIRIIRHEGAWHGRRRADGCMGGEPVLARGPWGLLTYFEATVKEIANLVAWARESSSGPVAIAGTSLGALSAQLAVSAMRDWPKKHRADAAFLLTTSQDILRIAFQSAIPKALGVPQLLQRSGWTMESLAPWLPLLAPGASGIDAKHIHVVLGARDSVTHFEGGRGLAEKWALPEENILIRKGGHFTTYLDLWRDPAPLTRFAGLLKRL